MKLIYIFTLFLLKPAKSLKPNILLLVVDDLRPALGAYRDPNAHTPNIDRLAEESVVFYNAYAQQALCAPSRNSFLTSRRPDSLHLYDFYSYWRDVVGNYTTLPQHFKDKGYYTRSIGKVFHPGISSNWTDDYPYSWSCEPFHPSTEEYKDANVCLNRDGERVQNLVCPVRVREQPGGTLPDIESTKEAVEFLRNYGMKGSQPFFLAVGLHKPHIPLKYPRKYLRYHPLNEVVVPKYHFMPPLMPIVAWNPWTDVRLRDDIRELNISFPFGKMPNKVTKSIIQSYAAASTYVDDLIGRILKKVQNNTIIVLIGDHGVSLGEHGEFSKYSNFDIATRVPFIIHVPNLTKQMTVSKKFVELVDLFPTLVELTQVSEKLPVCDKDGSNSILCTEGQSLVPHIVRLVNREDHVEKEQTSAAFSQYPRPGVYPTMHPDSDKPRLKQIKIMGYTIRTPEFRYTEWVGFDHCRCKPNWSNVYDRELYYHVIDPDENMNLSNRTELCDIMGRLRNRLILGWRYKIT